MSTPSAHPPQVQEELSLPLFFTTVVLSLASLYGLLWLCAPASVWLAQVGAAAMVCDAQPEARAARQDLLELQRLDPDRV